MNWVYALKIKSKLMIGFCVMIAFMGIIGVTGYKSTSQIEQDLEDIMNIRLPAIVNLLEADRDLHQLLVAERTMIFAETESNAFSQMFKEYEANLEQAHTRWNRFKALNLTAAEKALMPQYDAARAGEAGKGFAVVASEINELARLLKQAVDQFKI